ncbi:MAG TPA: trypsin-like peptidase domain-containing protein [Tepidisphaeraceae bacterium]|jgi:S1-C subfamily serine protease
MVRPLTAILLAAILLAALPAHLASAAKITLKDGTVIEGTAIQQGEKYWIKVKDGASRTVDKSEVVSIENTPSPSPAGTTAVPPATPATKASNSSEAFSNARHQADACDLASAAVQVWEDFLKENPDSAESASAKEELKHWKDLAKDNAEKIKGKWVAGEDRKKIVDDAKKLAEEGFQALQKNQTLVAVTKLEESVKLYPNSFTVNFLLGELAMVEHKTDDAMRYFEQAQHIKPKAVEAGANIGILLCDKKQYEKGIDKIYAAAKQQDTPAIALALAKALTLAPGYAKTAKAAPIVSAARLLASKYRINDDMLRGMEFIPIDPNPTDAGGFAGGSWSGTGFLIDDDGLILTNRHVADGAKKLKVVLSKGDEREAEVVAIDREQDLALIRIKPKANETLPYVQLSKKDSPNEGADCTVLGYPLIDRMGANIKVTHGVVSSASSKVVGADVVIDAKVNPGNSGGPILDKDGNVMAIVSMKTTSTQMEDTYGLGISAGNIRKFLVKNHVDIKPGDAGHQLSIEEIAQKVKPATVCIIGTK